MAPRIDRTVGDAERVALVQTHDQRDDHAGERGQEGDEAEDLGAADLAGEHADQAQDAGQEAEHGADEQQRGADELAENLVGDGSALIHVDVVETGVGDLVSDVEVHDRVAVGDLDGAVVVLHEHVGGGVEVRAEVVVAAEDGEHARADFLAGAFRLREAHHVLVIGIPEAGIDGVLDLQAVALLDVGEEIVEDGVGNVGSGRIHLADADLVGGLAEQAAQADEQRHFAFLELSELRFALGELALTVGELGAAVRELTLTVGELDFRVGQLGETVLILLELSKAVVVHGDDIAADGGVGGIGGEERADVHADHVTDRGDGRGVRQQVHDAGAELTAHGVDRLTDERDARVEVTHVLRGVRNALDERHVALEHGDLLFAFVVGLGIVGNQLFAFVVLTVAVSKLGLAGRELSFAVGQLDLAGLERVDAVKIGVVVLAELLDAGLELVVDGRQTGLLVLCLIILDVHNVLQTGNTGEKAENAGRDQDETEDCKQNLFHNDPPLFYCNISGIFPESYSSNIA